MQPNEIEFKEWLQKADEDLKSAKILLENNIIQTSLYHSQQCAEKTVKAILVKFNQIVPKTHDLTLLVSSRYSLRLLVRLKSKTLFL